MKLTKLSLAAILAAGALSSVSAAPLEEAIKDIDVSGFGRYRFDSESEKSRFGAPGEYRKDHKSAHRFTLDVNFKATLDDNFFSVIGLRYDAKDNTGSHKRYIGGIEEQISGLTNQSVTGDQGKGLWIRQYYVGFTGIPDTTVLFGRQPAGTFFTDDIVATGLKVANTSIPGVTLAGVFYTNFEGDDGDLGKVYFNPLNIDSKGEPNRDSAYIHQKNLWGVAAIGSFDWFSFQLWYAGLHKVAHLFAGELAANYAVSDDVSVRGKVQVAGTSLTKTFKDNYKYTLKVGGLTYDDKAKSAVSGSTFVGVDLGVSAYGFDADVGFARYGKKDKVSVHTLEDQGGLISAGEDLLNYANFSGKHTVWFAKGMYTYDAYSVGLDYVYDKAKHTDAKTTGQEFVARLGYKYSQKLNFKAWYSWITEKYSPKDEENWKNRKNHFRFEARYNF